MDPSLILRQFFLFHPVEVFFLFCHGFFEGDRLSGRLTSGHSWMNVSATVRMVGLVANVQVDSFDVVFFVVPSGRWKIHRGRLRTPLERFVRVLPEEVLSARAARSPGVSKSSLLPLRALVIPRGAFLLAFAVKVSTCFAREATSFPCSSACF
ncbi:hypothetical protein Bca4012_084281 [Brassica carinata]